MRKQNYQEGELFNFLYLKSEIMNWYDWLLTNHRAIRMTSWLNIGSDRQHAAALLKNSTDCLEYSLVIPVILPRKTQKHFHW